MNAKLIFTLCASLLLASSVGVAQTTVGECIKPVDTAKKCSGDKHFPVVTINTKKMMVDRLYVCAARTSTIEFRIVPPAWNVVGSVGIEPKDPKDTWLLKSNSPDERKIVIFVPAELDNNNDHAYTIRLADGRCIDPRIHVED